MVVASIKKARAVGVPLITISTPDPAKTLRDIVAGITNGGTPIICWDIVRGTYPANTSEESQRIASSVETTGPTQGNPVAFLVAAEKLPAGTIAVMLNLTEYLDGPGSDQVRQAVWNLRDPYKATRRTLIGLGQSITLPPSLVSDFITIDEPLPNEEELVAIAAELEQAATKRKDIAPNYAAARAALGLSAFGAEQAISLNCSPNGIDVAGVWESKRRMVQIKGLSVDKGTETFADVGGQENAKEFGRALFAGPEPPSVVVRVEEIEKVMAGAAGDLSGTSQDALQVLLNAMQDYRWSGLLAFGPAGTGKSYYSKVLARSFGAYALTLDLNATKGGLVGSSEAAIRAAIRTIYAIGGERVFWVGTCNKLDTLPPELRRRFRMGTWFFDMPDAEERAAIWQICLRKNGLALDSEIPDDALYSSADIANVCETARAMGRTPKDVSRFIVPAGQSGRDQIEACRRLADGRFISASYPGPYRMSGPDSSVAAKPRRVFE